MRTKAYLKIAKQLLILSLVIGNSWATTLAVPNIILPSSSTIQSFVSADKTNDSDAATNKLLQQQLGNFSAQIRSNLVQKNHFQLVDADNNLVQSYLLSESINATGVETHVPESATYAQQQDSSTVTPDYMLIGTLSSLSAGEEVTPIARTNKSSAIYSIDLTVDYKLIRTSDQRHIASFTAAGHAGDVKLAATNTQKTPHNINKLIAQLGNDLASEVMIQINNQIASGKLVVSQEHAPISKLESSPLLKK